MKKYLMLLLFSAVSLLGQGMEERPVSKVYQIDELVALLLQNNPELLILEKDDLIENERYRIDRRWPNPAIRVDLGQGKPLAADEESRRLWGVGVDFSLPNPLARAYALKGRSMEKEAAGLLRLEERWRVIHSVRLCLYDLQRLEAQLELQDRLLADLETVMRITEARVDVGEAKPVEMLQARAVLLMARSRRCDLENAVKGRRQELHAALGGTMPVDISVARDEAGIKPVPGIADLEREMRESPSMEARRVLLDMKSWELRAARSAWFPDIALQVGRSREVDATIWKAGLSVELPLFSGRFSRVPLIRHELERARLGVRDRELQLMAEVSSMLGEMDTLAKMVNAFDEGELKAGRESLRLAEMALKAGEINLHTYLDTCRDWFELQMKRPETVARYRAACSALEAMIGGFDS